MPQSQRVLMGETNGVNVDQLGETVKAIQTKPDLGQFQFRADGQWLDGGLNRTKIEGFYGAGEEHKHAQSFTFDADEPPVLLGKDRGANPVEYLLKALAACVTTSLVFHAAARGIKIHSVKSRLEGDLDVRGFLGLTNEVPKGYQGINVTLQVESDATAEALEECARFSPVLDSITRPVQVALAIEKY